MPGMDSLAEQSAKETDTALQDQETKMLANTNLDWDSFRPQITDKVAFDKLMAVVKEAQAKNEQVANIKKNIMSLGKGVVSVAKQVATLASKASGVL